MGVGGWVESGDAGKASRKKDVGDHRHWDGGWGVQQFTAMILLLALTACHGLDLQLMRRRGADVFTADVFIEPQDQLI